MTAADRQAGPALSLDGVRFTWPDGAFSLAVDALSIGRGEAVFLRGPSGSGKSTLLSLLCGIVAPDAGEIAVMGAPFSALPPPRRDRVRAERFGVIFQMFNLLPYLPPVDNVILPLAFAPTRAARVGPDRAGEARRLLGELGLEPAVAGARRSDRLSVGQQQRVAVARALIGGPDIVIADEPTSALDMDAQDAFLELLFGQVKAAGATLLMVSHDAALAPRFDRALSLTEIARAVRAGAA
ncbi:MAG: ATP-binding cassette domain-containing protein [Pseudomonadota bacterium]